MSGGFVAFSETVLKMVWMPSRYPCGNVICNDKEEGTHERKYGDCRSESGEELTLHVELSRSCIVETLATALDPPYRTELLSIIVRLTRSKVWRSIPLPTQSMQFRAFPLSTPPRWMVGSVHCYFHCGTLDSTNPTLTIDEFPWTRKGEPE